jgi:hypothetical protein
MHHTPLHHAILAGLIALSLALPAWAQPQTTMDIGTPELITVWKDPDFDYLEGNGSEKFEFDVQMRGPMLGFAIHF